MKKFAKPGDMILMEDGTCYVLASLIVPNISIAYIHGLRVTMVPIGKKRKGDPGPYHNSPPYLEVDAVIAYLMEEAGGRDGLQRFAIKILTTTRDRMRAESIPGKAKTA